MPVCNETNPRHVEPPPDFRDIFDFKPAELNLLAGGDVTEPLAELLADFRQRAELCRAGDAVRHTNPHHEVPRRLLAKKNSGPLQSFLVAVGYRFPAFRSVARNLREDIQSVFFFFILFDLVQYSAPAVNRECTINQCSSAF